MLFSRRERPRFLAEFATPEEMSRALEALRAAGYRELETYTPFDMPRTTPSLGLGRGCPGSLLSPDFLAGSWLTGSSGSPMHGIIH